MNPHYVYQRAMCECGNDRFTVVVYSDSGRFIQCSEEDCGKQFKEPVTHFRLVDGGRP